MSKKDFSLARFVRGAVDSKAVTENGYFNFSWTAKTVACEDGHVVWLENKFEGWRKFVLSKTKDLAIHPQIKIGKSPRPGKKGSIKISMNVKGRPIFAFAESSEFASNIKAAMRKSLALDVLALFPPDFDYEDPKFEATHVHHLKFTVAATDHKKATDNLNELVRKKIDLARVMDKKGAILKNLALTKENELVTKVSITMRWKNSATKKQRRLLHDSLEDYFLGMRITMQNQQIISV